MSAVRLVRSPGLSSAAEYAYAAVVTSGSRLVFTAGACPLDEAGATVGVGDIPAQAAQVMANLRVSLADAGARLDNVVRTTVYVASSEQRDLVAAWNVVRDALAPHDPPSTLLGVAALGYTGQLVEVDAVAAIPPPRPTIAAPGVLRGRIHIADDFDAPLPEFDDYLGPPE